MDVDSQPMMEETILVGDDLMTGPPSLVVPQEIASHVLQGVDLCVGKNLKKADAKSLRYALACMPNLEDLDLSDNSIGDEGLRKLTPCFVETSETCSHMTCLKFESCELSFDGVNHLLRSLTTFKGPLKSLSVAENYLGRVVTCLLSEEVQKSSIGARATDSERVMKFTKDDINLFDYNVPQRVNEFVSAALSRANITRTNI